MALECQCRSGTWAKGCSRILLGIREESDRLQGCCPIRWSAHGSATKGNHHDVLCGWIWMLMYSLRIKWDTGTRKHQGWRMLSDENWSLKEPYTRDHCWSTRINHVWTRWVDFCCTRVTRSRCALNTVVAVERERENLLMFSVHNNT